MTTTTATTSDREAGPVPTPAELVDRARALRPLLSGNATEGEQARRVVQESIDALADAGLFKLMVPRRYGGYETSLGTLLDVCAEVGEADGGTSWVVTLLNAGAWMTSLFPVRAQDEVFGADPSALVSGVVTPTSTSVKVDGGYRVSGRWYYNSGSWHADWAVLGIPFTDDDGRVLDQGIALIPRSDTTLEETWFVAGMRSSGSNCLVAQDVFVPEHRTQSVSAAIEGDYRSERLADEPLYRSAFVSVLALSLVGPQLGLGRAALELVREKAGKKPISHTFFETQAASAGFQLQLARAALMLDTAALHAHRAARDLDEAAGRGDFPDYATRARVRADVGYAAEHVTGAIDLLLTAHGAASFAEVNPCSASGATPPPRPGTPSSRRTSPTRSTARSWSAPRITSRPWSESAPVPHTTRSDDLEGPSMSWPPHAPRVGTWIKIPAIEVLEALAVGGIGLVVIDCEHGAMGRREMWTMVGLGKARGLTVLVRVAGHRAEDAQAALDAGADGLIVPRVDSASEARAVVDAVRFPPLGARGGSPSTRAGGWGAIDPAALVAHGNHGVALIAQVETAAAVDDVRRILAVEGVDGVMVGPFDLALSTGLQPGGPALDAQLRLVEVAVEQAGPARVLAGVAPDAAAAATMLERGYTFVLVGADTSMLAAAARALSGVRP